MTNLSEKPCRSKRKRKLRETRCKSETKTKTVINKRCEFYAYGTENGLTFIETQESNDSYCFHVSKFITRLLRHSKKVHREDDGAVHNDQVIDECKKKQFDNTEYWSVERKKEFVNVPHWSIEKWISVLAKGGGQKKRFQYCLNPNHPQKFLFLRAIRGHSGSTINRALQDNVLVPEVVTEYIHHVGNRKELRSTVNHGLIPGGVSLRTGRQAVFFTFVNPMDNQDGLGETMRLVTCKNRALQKYLETLSEYGILVQFEVRSTKRTSI